MKKYFLEREDVPIKQLLLQIVFVFCFIYEVQPIGVPDWFTSRKIMFYIGALCFLLSTIKYILHHLDVIKISENLQNNCLI